ncbi:hypothetical protein NQZ68_004599 [Dissostichus eleginoides]|nr:hypothetical protein NQZ68_004599 [Dissostichus eleginoides]
MATTLGGIHQANVKTKSTSHNLDLHSLRCPQQQGGCVLGASSWSQQSASKAAPPRLFQAPPSKQALQQ